MLLGGLRGYGIGAMKGCVIKFLNIIYRKGGSPGPGHSFQ